MRASVRVLLSLVMERCWRAVVGIRVCGSGKVSQSCRLSSEGFERWADFLVQPDSDFECIAVMMEHGQDVKSLAWHPHEEVSHQSTTSADSRSSRQHHTIPTFT
jgi:hypothetical protein